MVDDVLEFAHFIGELVHFFIGDVLFTHAVADGVIPIKDCLCFCYAFLDAFADGFVGVELRFLLEVADACAFGDLALSHEVFVDSCEDAKERGFTAAV